MRYWLSGLALVLLAAAGLYYAKIYQSGDARDQTLDMPPALVQEAGDEEGEAPDEPGMTAPAELVKKPVSTPVIEELPLPDLADSDPLATETLTGLFGESAVLQYFANENMVSRVVATIDALGSKQIPGAIQVVQGPGGEFMASVDQQPGVIVRNDEGDPIPQFVLDPANYKRYQVYVELLEALDAAQVVSQLRKHHPLFQEAYGQLGYPDGNFDDRLIEVIDELLATPEVTGPVRLVKPEAYYLYTEEDLESLPAGQKILLRMGSENAARVKSKLSEIRESL